MSSAVRSGSTDNLRSKRKAVHSEPIAPPPAKQAKTPLSDITNHKDSSSISSFITLPSCPKRDPILGANLGRKEGPPDGFILGDEIIATWDEDLRREEAKRDEGIKKHIGSGSDFEFADSVAASTRSNRSFGCVIDPTMRVYIHGELHSNVVVGLEVNNLCCREQMVDDKELGIVPMDSIPYVDNVSLVLSGNNKHSNKFGVLPEEILLIIFKKLPYNWSKLLQLRLVCKQWSRLLVDRSLKYGQLTEDLRMMVDNERRHHSKIRDYLANNRHPEITPQMRDILIDWLVDVALEFNLCDETLFLCTHLVDRYLSQLSNEHSITKGNLQLLGLSSLLAASKYEEVYVPMISDLIYISENTYNKQEIIGMEISLLNVVRFDMSAQTSKHFVQYFLKSVETTIQCPKTKTTLHNLSHYFVELTLPKYQFIRYLPSMIGAAVVCLALLTLGLRWNYVMEYKSLYSWDELHNCVQEIYEVVEKAPTATCKAVYNKYQLPNFDSISSYPISEAFQQNPHPFL